MPGSGDQHRYQCRALERRAGSEDMDPAGIQSGLALVARANRQSVVSLRDPVPAGERRGLERRALSSGRGLAANFRLDLNRTGRREAVAAPPPKLEVRHEGTVDALVPPGLSLPQQGRLDEARDFYRQALQRQPRHFGALHLLGVLAAQSKEPQRAVELIGEALSIEPRSAPAHNNYGNALRELGRHEAALRSFDTAIQLNPGYAEAYCNRGLVLAELKRHDAAIQNFGHALVLRPHSAETHMSRGNSLRELGRYEAAVASYQQAIALKPGYAEAHAARGIALF